MATITFSRTGSDTKGMSIRMTYSISGSNLIITKLEGKRDNYAYTYNTVTVLKLGSTSVCTGVKFGQNSYVTFFSGTKTIALSNQGAATRFSIPSSPATSLNGAVFEYFARITASGDENISSTSGTNLYKKGTSATLTYTPKEGYKVINIEQVDTTSYWEDRTELKISSISTHCTYKATTTPISYIIIYNGNGNKSGEMETQTFLYEESKNLLTNTYVRPSYYFKGWATTPGAIEPEYLDGDLVTNLSSEEGEEVTLYAVWERKPDSTITFKSGTEIKTQIKTADIDTKLEPNTFTKIGYNFISWKDTNGNIYADGATITSNENLDLEAQWERKKVIITYSDSLLLAEEFTYGSEIKNLGYNNNNFKNYLKTGYTLVGWTSFNSVTPSISDDFIEAHDGEVLEQTAIWTPNKYKYTIALNGGTGESNVLERIYDEDLTLTIPTPPKGRKFKGWKCVIGINQNLKENEDVEIDYEGEVIVGGPVEADDITMVAIYKQITYSLEINSNGGQIESEELTKDLNYEETYVLPSVGTKQGERLLGFDFNQNVKIPEFSPGVEISKLTDEDNKTVILYAIWGSAYTNDLYYKENESWKKVETYYRVNGTWFPCAIYKKENGVWKK